MKKLWMLSLLILFMTGCQSTPVVSYAPPVNLTYNDVNETITWQSELDATGFILSINDELYELSSRQFDFSDYPSGEYVIKVKALYGENVSRYTFPLTITLVKVETMTVSIGDQIEVSEVNGAQSYNFEVFNLLNESIYIQNAPLRVLDYDDYSGLIKIEVKALFSTFVISNHSFLLDTNGYTYQKDTDNLTFEFDLKGGTFNGLSAQPTLTDLDYSFTGNTLTIYQTYFDGILADNPSRSSVIFAYVISNGPYTIIGYITVNMH